MKLSGRQLLVLLELYVNHGGKAQGTFSVKNEFDYSEETCLSLVSLGLVTMQREFAHTSVQLTPIGKRAAKAMVEAAEGALT